MGGVPEKKVSPTKKKKTKKRVSVKDLLRSIKGIHLFAVHLTKEFSIELLLSYIEMSQYEKICIREHIDEHMDKYDDETLAGLAKYEFLEFAESIPTSSL